MNSRTQQWFRPAFFMTKAVQVGFASAKERFAALGVDVSQALDTLASIPISLQCWQGDDVGGFEHARGALGGGIAVTGNYPGKARNADELRQDLAQALQLIPGRHRVNLHASYGEPGRRQRSGRGKDRDSLDPRDFSRWIDWAKRLNLGLDFNPTCFAHPFAADGFTLSHRDPAIRRFWIEHCRRARRVGKAMGQAQKNPCVTNVWIPDGFKDTPADRRSARERLVEALDEVFREPLDPACQLDAVEGKLFGIGAESCTIGSHEFYLGYAITRGKLLCLDMGHYHPTESVADKLTSVLQFLPQILLHLSRGVRWDSDHVVTSTDELHAVIREVVANAYLKRVRIGLDYFDASINRVAAWVIGVRAVQRSLLMALLEPPGIAQAEREGNLTARLALQEEVRWLPVGAVWDWFCDSRGVPPGESWLREIQNYEKRVLARRSKAVRSKRS